MTADLPCDVLTEGDVRCNYPAHYGSRTACCQESVLLCTKHLVRVLWDIADAKLKEHGVECPQCFVVHPPPVLPSDVFDVSYHLGVQTVEGAR